MRALLGVACLLTACGHAHANPEWDGPSIALGAGTAFTSLEVARDWGFFVGGGVTVSGQGSDSTKHGAMDDGVNSFFSLRLAWDVQPLTRLVAGVFVEFDHGAGGGQKFALGDGLNTLRYDGEIKRKEGATVGGRVGVLLSDEWLLYGLVAYGAGRIDVECSPCGLRPSYQSFERTTHGVSFGGGFEKSVAPGIFLRGEYRWTQRSAAQLDRQLLDERWVRESEYVRNGESLSHDFRASIVLRP